jgi:signal peptidase I
MRKKEKIYSIHRTKKILRSTYTRYKKKKKNLSESIQKKFESLLLSLQKSIIKKEKTSSSKKAHELEVLYDKHLKKSPTVVFFDGIFALVFALIIAIFIRQMWFEFYNIPTGSMRPTFKESDFLMVSKTDFSINTLGKTSHLYFDDKLVNRGGIVIFSSADMDVYDNDTKYFYLFPGKKQFIKRLIGKPGDTLYFYGGQIYGVDARGNEITDFYNKSWLKKIDHIPFIRFDGNVITPPTQKNGIYSPAYIYQTGYPVAKLSFNNSSMLEGEILNFQNNAKYISNYYDLWGYKNYGMARIITRDQAQIWHPYIFPKNNKENYFLEITHHPTIKKPKLAQDEMHRLRPSMDYDHSLIPLDDMHMQKIFKNIYTARFRVINGKARRFSYPKKVIEQNPYSVPLPGVPNGCYEFYYGVAYKVYPGGITKKLPLTHPIYKNSLENIALLFNMGIELDTRFLPVKKDQKLVPTRYTYFRNNDLYILGSPIFLKNESQLNNFINNEYHLKGTSNHIPFVDAKAPLKADGSLDKEFIKRHGLIIPEKKYFVLGDNHAMSADSRDFGFVPKANLRGGPVLIFWPPGNRFGLPPQPHYTIFCLPRIVIWAIFIIIISISYIIFRKKYKNPLRF